MKINSYIIYIILLFFTNNICAQKLKSSKKITTKNLEISLCFENGVGFSEFNINEIEKYVIETIGIEDDNFKEQILISNKLSDIHYINNPSTNPTLTTLCNFNGYSSFTDIAINSKKEIFICPTITAISNTCETTNIEYNYSLWGVNSMSFDDLDNLYLGFGTESFVVRTQISGIQTKNNEIWHDFEIGTAGGDFVLLDNKMYVSWKLTEDNYRLYEVTVNANREYISHVDLGKLPNETYGLASELGKLYGVTPNKLFKINLSDFTFVDIIQNPEPENEWYGATGKHEAITFKLSTHLTINDAETKTKAIKGNWTNTVAGEQNLYIRIENSLTGEYDIVILNIKISNYPNVNEPKDLVLCADNNLNIFNLDEISSQMQINSSDKLTFTYFKQYNVDKDPLPQLYQSIDSSQSIIVKVNNDNCEKYYNLRLINNEKPAISTISTKEFPTLLESCNFDKDDNGFFNLDDIKNNIILENGNFNASYYLSASDAKNNTNKISNIYYLENSLQEIFIRVTDSYDCFSISNFFLSEECLKSQNPLLYFSFPKFITPNNDGLNDYWNVIGGSDEVKKESTVSIFDRYGKKITTFNPYSDKGWDGTYEGIILPETDYWFLFITNTGIKKAGHISVKR